MKKFFLIIIFINLLLYPVSIYSQAVVQKISDLNFGDVFIGYNYIVRDTDPGALKISFYHTLPKEDFLIILTLPATLTNGINTIPINFSGYASWSRVDAPTGRTYFNPYTPLRIRNARRNVIHYLWLGGVITSSSTITPGVYSATIIITIEVI